MWKELIKQKCNLCSFKKPTYQYDILRAESLLNNRLHPHLVSLLLETNGCFGEYELNLIWSLENIIEINKSFRENEIFPSIYMSFENTLFFADAGNGSQFFYPVLADNKLRDSIFIWSHENDSRSWVAPNLETYIDWWLSGKIII